MTNRIGDLNHSQKKIVSDFILGIIDPISDLNGTFENHELVHNEKYRKLFCDLYLQAHHVIMINEKSYPNIRSHPIFILMNETVDNFIACEFHLFDPIQKRKQTDLHSKLFTVSIDLISNESKLKMIEEYNKLILGVKI